MSFHRIVRFQNRGSLKFSTFSSKFSSGKPFYDSQSGRWVTPHNPNAFQITVDSSTNAELYSVQTFKDFKEKLDCLSKRYSKFLLPSVEDLNSNHMDEMFKCLNLHKSTAILSSKDAAFIHKKYSPDHLGNLFVKHVIINVNIDVASTLKFLKEDILQLSSQGHRIRCTLCNFDTMTPWDIGSLAAELCDLGTDEIFLDNKSNHEYRMEVDEIVQVLEEICYIVSYVLFGSIDFLLHVYLNQHIVFYVFLRLVEGYTRGIHAWTTRVKLFSR